MGALERARAAYGTGAYDDATIEFLFPEVKESKDERIRKEIRNFLIDMECKKEWITYLEHPKDQKAFSQEVFDAAKHEALWGEQKPILFIPKFRLGDKLISTKNPHLTYNILEVGHINELGNPEYKVEIFQDNEPATKHNIHYMECRNVDEWGKLIEQRPVEWSEEDEAILGFIQDAIDKFDFDSIKTYYAVSDWFKSHCSRPHYKPSEEQMEALMLAIEGKCAPTSYMSRRLEDLYEALVNEFHVECKLDK